MSKLSPREKARLASQAAAEATSHKPAAAAAPAAPAPAQGKMPITGPGQFAAFMAKESDALQENAELKAALAKWDGALPVQELDPNLVDDSKWANRHQDSFAGPEFTQLKEEIRSAGGNVQPIKVRPHPTKPGRFEVVFGHRRLRACRELGIKVKAMVEQASDQELFIDMDRENRSREDLRPYEQGVMYLKALHEKLFDSQSELARATGANPAIVSQSIKIAQLPGKILDAFPSRLDIQYRWAKPLAEMVEKHPDRLAENLIKLSTADAVAGLVVDDDGDDANKPLTAAEVFTILTDLKEPKEPDPQEFITSASGAVLAQVSRKGGRLTIAFEKDIKLDDKRIEKIKKALEKLDLS